MLIKKIVLCFKKSAQKIKTHFPATIFHDQYYLNLDLEITKFTFFKFAATVCLISTMLAFTCIYRLSILLFSANKCFSCYGWEWWTALLLAKITSSFFIINWQQIRKNKISKKAIY